MATSGMFLKGAKKMTSSKKSNLLYDLSIVIPAYREEKRIGKSLDELAQYLRTEKNLKHLAVEVVVVIADSPDNTLEIVLSKEKKFKKMEILQSGPKVGKGRDVMKGMLFGQGEAIIFMDADLATPLRHLPKFYSTFLKGSDLVIATRNLRKHHPNYSRRLVSNSGNFMFRLAGGVWVEDSQCGFKLFSHKSAQLCFSKLNILGWGFDMEILAIAKANKLKISNYRIDDWISVPDGSFEEGLIKNSLISLGELLYIFANRVRRKYLE